MAQRHPIDPPPELVQKWFDQAELATNRIHCIANRAAQWGADQELKACCEWMADETPTNYINALRAARRSKPPGLKEQALEALSEAVKMADDVPPEGICSGQADIIRRALEQLP